MEVDFPELDAIVPDVLQDPGDLIGFEASLESHKLAGPPWQLPESAKEAQRLIHNQQSLKLHEAASIEVTTDGNSGMHFLMHAPRASGSPLFTLSGPGSGTLCPGDEAAFPGHALLKLAASRKPTADGWTEEHSRLNVVAWREVLIGAKHGKTDHSDGTLRANIRGPKVGEDFIDVKPKVSLITWAVPASNKRMRGASMGASQAVLSSNDHPADGGQCLGNADICRELMRLRAQVQRNEQQTATTAAQVKQLLQQAQLNVPTAPSSAMTCF